MDCINLQFVMRQNAIRKKFMWIWWKKKVCEPFLFSDFHINPKWFDQIPIITLPKTNLTDDDPCSCFIDGMTIPRSHIMYSNGRNIYVHWCLLQLPYILYMSRAYCFNSSSSCSWQQPQNSTETHSHVRAEQNKSSGYRLRQTLHKSTHRNREVPNWFSEDAFTCRTQIPGEVRWEVIEAGR